MAKEELDTLLMHDDFKETTIPLLIFANKMDLKGALTAEQCVDEMQLERIVGRPWKLVSSNGVTGDGLDIGMTWLSETIKPAIRGKYSQYREDFHT